MSDPHNDFDRQDDITYRQEQEIAVLRRQLAEAQRALHRCYVAAGSDPAGETDCSRHAIDAVEQQAARLAEALRTQGLARKEMVAHHKERMKLRERAERAEQLLLEVIGNDDPRTTQTDSEWREILHGKDDHDHVDITVYAGTLRRILATVRPRGV